MKCLRKYEWVKLPRNYPDMGKGLMGYWAKLAARAAFRKGNVTYCGHIKQEAAPIFQSQFTVPDFTATSLF